MPGLLTGPHVFFGLLSEVVDGRDRPGHDSEGEGDGEGYCTKPTPVMPALVRVSTSFLGCRTQVVDGRGHDSGGGIMSPLNQRFW